MKWRRAWIVTRTHRSVKPTHHVCWYDDAGRQRSRSAGTDKGRAKDICRRMELDLNAGTLMEPNAIMLADYIREHLDIAATQVRPSTVRDQKIVLGQFLQHVENRRLDTITMSKVEAFIGRRRSEGIAEATANKMLRTLKAVFTRAVARGYLKSNPCAGIAKLREPDRTHRILSADEVKALVGACRLLRWRVLIYLAATTGMRIGELVNLRWEDVDLTGAAISIRCRDDFRTKSGHNRTVPLSSDAVEGLSELRDAKESGEWVFSCRNGKRMGNDIHRTLYAIQRDAGFGENRCTFHDLRRTFLSHLQMAGVSAAVAQKLAGHSSITTTEKFYTRILPDALRAAPARLPYVDIGITSFSRLGAGTPGKARTA